MVQAKIISVIEVQEKRGNGTPFEPYRNVPVYFAPDGTFLADLDDFKIKEASENVASLLRARKHIDQLLNAIEWALHTRAHHWQDELRRRAGLTPEDQPGEKTDVHGK
jgi:hypothetical protein